MEPCTKEREIGGMLKSVEHFEQFMTEIKDNHLHSIYDKLNDIVEKMSSRRPPWSVVWIISILTTFCGILLTAFLMGK